MASYHFHFQQQDEGHREDVRPMSTSLVPFVSPYVTVPHDDSSFHGFQHRARPTQSPSCNNFCYKAHKTPSSSTVLQISELAAAADGDGDLEDPAPLPLGPTVEAQDLAAPPQGP